MNNNKHFFHIISEIYSRQQKKCYGTYVSWKTILTPSKHEAY